MKASDSSKILVIEKMIRIIDALGAEKSPIGVNELSRKLSLNGATTYRILRTLMDYGWIYQNGEGKYTIGYKLSLGFNMEKFYLVLKDISYCVMKGLTDQVNEAVNLVVRQNEKGIVLQQTRTSKMLDYVTAIDSVVPLYATSCGKILLSELPEYHLNSLLGIMDFKPITAHTITSQDEFSRHLQLVRERGYATDIGESLENASCISTAVRGPSDEIIAALSFTGILSELSPEKERYYFNLLQKASKEISKNMFQIYDGKIPRADNID
jgi:DNA-binding IclR family transcriptional regulator